MAAVSIDTIKSYLLPHVYVSLTGGDDTITQSAIDAAVTLITNGLKKFKKPYDETNATIIEATKLVTVYQLYSRVEKEDQAKDKLAQAEAMLKNEFGSGASISQATSGTSRIQTQAQQGTPVRIPLASVQSRESIKDKVLGGKK